ncbi:hypothetical protein WJX72_005047 [[Myrmecia] bisecta]|uniref:Vesicle transport protein n=1 Tax=[Myrmecia] bisecta TaxID=41462 RepID=A0AAW1P4R9_9CHLO
MSYWTKLKEGVGLGQPEPAECLPSSLLHQFDEATTMSRTNRVYGFAICLGVGLFFGFLSSMFFLMPTKFAVLYTFSNVFYIASTMFLMGPCKQLSKMFDQGRIFATAIYLVAMALTLWAAIKLHSLILTLVFVIIQFLALTWYCLSYIPFAREVAWKMIRSCVGE